MVKGKRNGLTFTECLVKICRFLLLPPSFRKWSYHNTTQSECAHRLVQTFSLILSRPKCPASLSKWQAFSDLLLLVSAVNPSSKLTVFMAYSAPTSRTNFWTFLREFLFWSSKNRSDTRYRGYSEKLRCTLSFLPSLTEGIARVMIK